MELHRCRFVNYTPAAISAVIFSPSTYRRTIPGGANEALETLAWAHQVIPVEDEADAPEDIAEQKKQLIRTPPRLFSAGLNALVTEWDLDTLRPKARLDSMGGAVWCIAVNPQQTILAAGCEDGCVRLFDIADGEFAYLRSFEPTKARILSMAWSKDGRYLVTGSADSAIRKWDISTGRISLRMTVGKEGKVQTMVWAVLMLEDDTIVSGDSLGRVQLWNSEMGTVKFLLDYHKADVLCLAAAENGVIYSSGVDRKINQYTRVNTRQDTRRESSNNESSTKWILASSNRPHSHDVRGLDVSTLPSINSVVSGGIGVQLVVCRHSSFSTDRKQYLPLNPMTPLVDVSTERQWLLSRFDHSVRLWQLGQRAPVDVSAAVDKGSNANSNHALGDPLFLKESYRLLLEIQLQDMENLIASSLSQDGQWMAVATLEQVKLFRILPHPTINDRWIAKKMRLPSTWNEVSRGAHQLVFSPDNSKLLVATPDYELAVVDLTQWSSHQFPLTIKPLPTPKTTKHSNNNNQHVTIRSLIVSSDGQWAVIGDVSNHIHIYHLDTLKYHGILPVFMSVHTHLTFHPDARRLFITLANHEVHIYDVESQRLLTGNSTQSTDTPSSTSILSQLPKAFRHSRDHILGVLFDPQDPNLIILWGNQFIGRVYMDDRSTSQDITMVNNDHITKKNGKHKGRASVVVVKRRRQQQKEEEENVSEDNSLISDMEIVSTNTNSSKSKSNPLAIVLRYQPLLNVSMVGHHQMMVVERPLHHILQQLPASFYAPTYGT
ncbi:quinon protein alcohol dehydrogenase-like superfamily [Syncephalis fuscata]|nr:quinon protein alcohol dehydrogenase-like superfamily [Syncephalis fuscata]